MTYVGIDVSKATFVVAYSSAKSSKTKTFKNTTKGVHEFIQTLSASEHHCVLEATGNYSSLLVYLLSQVGITVSLENPLKIKNFARVMLSVTKTAPGTGEPVEGPLLHLVFRHSRLERPEVRAETCWGGGGGPAAQSVQNRKQFNICLFHLTGCTTLVRLCHRCSGRTAGGGW